MAGRSLQAPYRDRRLKRPDFPLDEAIAWFLSDYATEVQPTTLAAYRSHLRAFCESLPTDRRVLASLEPETVEAHLRRTANKNTKMNKAISLRSFAKYLATRKIWYSGTDDARVSVLRDVRQGRPTPKGQPGYKDEELRTIVRVADDGQHRLRNRAYIAVLLHGFRAKEARLMLLRNCVMPKHDELQGEFLIETEEGTKHRTGGVRAVPMEPFARRLIREYIQLERAAYTGSGDEPLFLTDEGGAFTRSGWHSMARRIRDRLRSEGIQFRQHRLRPTRARQLHEASWPDSAIMEVLGWKSTAMLRRYLGTIPISRLKQYPTTLDRVFGKAM